MHGVPDNGYDAACILDYVRLGSGLWRADTQTTLGDSLKELRSFGRLGSFASADHEREVTRRGSGQAVEMNP